MEDQERFQSIFFQACEELRDSEFLEIVLAILMLFYCYANYNEVPSDFEKAKVFDPMQIMEFANIKTYNAKDAPVFGYNICHWVYELTGRQMNHEFTKHELTQTFDSLHKAAKLPFGDVVAPLNDMKEVFMSLRREYREFPHEYCHCHKCQHGTRSYFYQRFFDFHFSTFEKYDDVPTKYLNSWHLIN